MIISTVMTLAFAVACLTTIAAIAVAPAAARQTVVVKHPSGSEPG
jgi:hypothetical protein